MVELVDFFRNSCSSRIMLGASVFHGELEGRMGNQQCSTNFFCRE